MGGMSGMAGMNNRHYTGSFKPNNDTNMYGNLEVEIPDTDDELYPIKLDLPDDDDSSSIEIPFEKSKSKPKKRRAGRPKGSKNKPKIPVDPSQPLQKKRKPGRPKGSKNKLKATLKII